MWEDELWNFNCLNTFSPLDKQFSDLSKQEKQEKKPTLQT